MGQMDAPPLSFTGDHVLYRLFDAEEKLLYVGITNHIGRRFGQHAAVQPWWSAVADCRTEFHRSRPELEAAERTAIRTERPLHNKAHKVMPPIDSDGLPIADIPGDYFEDYFEDRPRPQYRCTVTNGVAYTFDGTPVPHLSPDWEKC